MLEKKKEEAELLIEHFKKKIKKPGEIANEEAKDEAPSDIEEDPDD